MRKIAFLVIASSGLGDRSARDRPDEPAAVQGDRKGSYTDGNLETDTGAGGPWGDPACLQLP